ncbi:hypothetical protein ACQPYK_47620 [Streptosporangium sp. CA-135522]|uniref:hypothetical protein n=1 Tax=Streptosporangium sp. CA-135522 TaxID=3240072 RepID=UPI003D91F60C
MVTPSRKPSRATIITASVAIGVFGAGAGLGTVIAARSQPVEGQVLRLAAGTYRLDEDARVWKSGGSAAGDPAVPLSGADEGSTITKNRSKDTRVCLTTTADGHAVGGGGEGCVALPVLAAAAAALAPLQRPGNPRSTAEAPPKKASSAPEPKSSKAVQPVANPRRNPPAQPPPAPVHTAAAQPPAKPAHPAAPPPPAPTKKIAGDISESGSLVDYPAKQAKQVEVKGPEKEPTTKPIQPSATPKPIASGEPAPSGTARPAEPTATPRPPRGHGRHHRPGTPTARPHRPGQPSDPARPSPSARQNRPSTGPSPDTRQLPTPTPDTGQLPTPTPDTRRLPTPDPDTGQLPTPTPDTAQNPSQAPDGTVLQPATPPLPDGQAGDSLPIFRDPELLRRAQEALGLDKNMRYTDENGVWDLNIAPPGTPPCRNYSADELPKQEPQSGSPAIPLDSCQWPAFIRWLYADPAPGQVSNWTKFTGLPERNLELVVTNPSTLPPAQTGPGQVEPDRGNPPGTGRSPERQAVQPDSGQSGPGQVVQPDSGRIQPEQAVQPDSRQGHQDRAVQPDTGQIEPDEAGYTGP